MIYGDRPEAVRHFELSAWTEYMHYMYLPVLMPGNGGGVRLPKNLEWARSVVEECVLRENVRGVWDHDTRGVLDGWAPYDTYVYLTVRRGYATPGNPLNRPGWHSDGFGTDDVNYIWASSYPTRFLLRNEQHPGCWGEMISSDHIESAKQFEYYAKRAELPHVMLDLEDGEAKMLYRLTPSVIHAAPTITEGGERAFMKISFSKSKYNLKGNAHNHLLRYDWKMYDRAELRNDPAYAGGDQGPQS